HPQPVAFVCLNGGTKAGTGTCRCTDLFTGRNCATPVCLNGGVVEKFPGNGRPLCECPAGYGGDHCEILSCSSSSPNVFGSTKRSLAVVIQSSFSQAELNSHINSGLTALLKYMGQADAFDEYIVSTFNAITVQNQTYAQVKTTPYSTSTAFLNATTSSAIMYQNSQSDTQPSLDALLQTIQTISYDKSSIFLFTDAPPYADTSDADMPNIVLAAIERQLQINVIVTAPYQMNSFCMQYPNSSIYSQLALQTGGTIVNLCQPYANSYPRDIITEFFTGYGITHHHVETLQEVLIPDCSAPSQTHFYVDDPSATVYAFVNSDQTESFEVEMSDNDSDGGFYQLRSQVLMPFFGIYQILPSVYNRNGYTLQVKAAANSTSGSCSVRIVEKTQLAVYLGFTPDPSKDSPSLTLKYG
ncbi:EGF-like domain protein, partial [Ancylostoma caninum]